MTHAHLGPSVALSWHFFAFVAAANKVLAKVGGSYIFPQYLARLITGSMLRCIGGRNDLRVGL